MQHSMTATAVSRPGRQVILTRQRRALMALVLALVVLGWCIARLGAPLPRGLGVASLLGVGSVYTVADVERQVSRDPADWIGRIVLVRGQPVSYLLQAPDGIVMQIGLVDPGRGHNARPLSLRWGEPDPLLSLLRRLPMVGRFAPRPRQLSWDTPAIYRIQLSRPPRGAYGGEDAVLLDADVAG